MAEWEWPPPISFGDFEFFVFVLVARTEWEWPLPLRFGDQVGPKRSGGVTSTPFGEQGSSGLRFWGSFGAGVDRVPPLLAPCASMFGPRAPLELRSSATKPRHS